MYAIMTPSIVRNSVGTATITLKSGEREATGKESSLFHVGPFVHSLE